MRSPIAKITDQCFSAVIRSYMASPKFRAYAPSTQSTWGRELRFAERPENLGALSVFAVRPALVQSFLDGMVDWPGKQASALAALKQLEKWALVRDLLPNPITLGCEAEGSDGGHIPWTEPHVALAEQHARQDLARAVALAAGTGQRGSDLVRMGPTDLETIDGHIGINLIQQKTKKRLWVPFTAPLIAAMEKWERRPGRFLLRPCGSPWTRPHLSDAWREQREGNPALEPLRQIGVDDRGKPRPAVMHGLRATACVRLNQSGATTRQISDWVGMSEPMVANYLRFSIQKENALAAVIMLDRTTRERIAAKRA